MDCYVIHVKSDLEKRAERVLGDQCEIKRMDKLTHLDMTRIAVMCLKRASARYIIWHEHLCAYGIVYMYTIPYAHMWAQHTHTNLHTSNAPTEEEERRAWSGHFFCFTRVCTICSCTYAHVWRTNSGGGKTGTARRFCAHSRSRWKHLLPLTPLCPALPYVQGGKEP